MGRGILTGKSQKVHEKETRNWQGASRSEAQIRKLGVYNVRP